MIIAGSGISMKSSSSQMQTTTHESVTTNLSNPSIFSVSKTEIVSLRLQQSSNKQIFNNSNPDTFDYHSPAYRKNTKDSIRNDRGRDDERRGASAHISNEGKQMAKNGATAAEQVKSVSQPQNFNPGIYRDFRYSLLDSIVRLLSGGKSDLFKLNPFLSRYHDKLNELKKNLEDSINGANMQPIKLDKQPVLVPGQQVQLNFEQVDTTTTFHEQQQMNFQASGTVKTADGREISLEVNLSMSSEFYSSNQTSVKQAMKDPLVINLGPGPVELTQTKYDFDIDCDGEADQISFVAGKSGFLAYDANNDGKINDGSELFGAKTGNGFGELAVHDKDSNGWIDEADDIFNKLRIWTKDDEGNDRLVSLGEAGIGAIYLGNVDTDYNLRGDDGSLSGQIRKTGIYLNENGTAGTVHHVDIGI